MRRYQGEELPEGCRIALISNDALGNYIVVTPLLQMLRTRHRPSAIDYYGGARTKELWASDTLCDWGFPLFGTEPREASEAMLDRARYDLVVNVEVSAWAKCFAAACASSNTFVCGLAVDHEGRKDLPFPNDDRGRLWQDQEWVAEDLTRRYDFLETGFIGEIFCRLAYLEGAVPRYRLPSAEPSRGVPDVLIATAASLESKLWPLRKWAQILEWLKRQRITVGLIGAPPSTQKQYWQGNTAEEELVGRGLAEDLRGAFSLPEVVGALGKARAVLTLDNGILHMACASGAPTVGLFRHGIHRLWAPPYENLTVLTGGPTSAVAEISADDVQESLSRAL